jgi:hypothetical protein
MKCATAECIYIVHSNIKNNGGTHCCKGCKTGNGHGLFCEKQPYIKRNGPIKIIVVGTKQSGSTRLFNLLIMLYKHLNKNVYSAWYKCASGKDNQYDVIISKCHDANISALKEYDIILSPIRHIFDCALSAKKRGFVIDYKKSCYNNIHLFNKYEGIADMVFVYEKYSLEYIKELCSSILKIKVEDNILLNIMEELDNMHKSKNIVVLDDKNNEQFKRTLLSQSHNTSGGKINKFLSEMTQEEITGLLNDKKINSFLKKLNYL